jgi:hypothetical protein
MKRVKILTFGDDIAEDVWPILSANDEDGSFSDNGGDPDGPAWMQNALAFCEDTIRRVKRLGGAVVDGYEADYMPTDNLPFYGQVYCGYSGSQLAYTTSAATARAIQRHYDMQVAAGR